MAKVPEQGALFSLTRSVNGSQHKLAAGEELPAGSRLILHIQALKQPCTALVTTFQRGKARAVDSMGPSLLELNLDEERTVDFTLAKPVKAGELFVVLLPRTSPTTDELSKLLGAWKKKPEDSQGPRSALHDRFSDYLARRDKSLTYAGVIPKELGGVRTVSALTDNPAVRAASGGSENIESKGKARGNFAPAYPWQKDANWLPWTAAQPGVFVYSLGK